MYRNDTICSSTHETYTTASVVLVETSIKEYGNGHSMLVTPKTTFELVVTPSEHFEGQITSACEYNKNNFHRCLKTGLGWNVRKSSNSREMVPFRKRETHKLAGIGSSNFDSKNISATVERSGCAGKVRQYKCSTVYSERRRDSLTPTMLQSMGIMANCNRQQYTTESSTHSRTVEKLSDQLSHAVIRQTEWEMNNVVLHQIFQIWGKPLVDLFAHIRTAKWKYSVPGRLILRHWQ